MTKQTAKLNIYDDTWVKNTFVHVLDTVLRSPVRFVIMPKKERPKSSSKHDSSKNQDCMYIAYRFRGYPAKEQATMLSQIIGSVRFIWNKMLADTKSSQEPGGSHRHALLSTKMNIRGFGIWIPLPYVMCSCI